MSSSESPLLCAFCRRCLLDGPRQAPCGDRLCRRCYSRLQNENREVKCPICHEIIDLSQCFHDKAVQMELANTTVQCSNPGCPFSHIHLQSCPMNSLAYRLYLLKEPRQMECGDRVCSDCHSSFLKSKKTIQTCPACVCEVTVDNLELTCLNLQSKEHLAQAPQVSGNHQIGGTINTTTGSSLNADAHLSRETKHHTCACEALSSSSSSQLTADCPVSIAIPTAREDSLKMSDVNYRMLVGPAGPGSTMPAELSATSSDPEGPHTYTEHRVYSTPSQESSCGGHEHSCLVVGKLS